MSTPSQVVVTLADMVTLLGQIRFHVDSPLKRGMVRVSIVSTSDPAPRKGDKGKIVKTTVGNVDFNRDTLRLRDEAGLPPVGGPLPWGEWVAPDSPVITHKGGYYFGCVPTTHSTAGAVGVACSSSFASIDGTPLPKGEDGTPHPVVDQLVCKKADGVTPLSGYGENGKRLRDATPSDYGYRVFNLQKCQVYLTLDGQRYHYAP